MDCSLLTEEQRQEWRTHQIEFLKRYPEYGRFNGEETYRQCGSQAPTPYWAALEIERLERELAGTQRLLDELIARDDRMEEMIRNAVKTGKLDELKNWLTIRVGVKFITDTSFGGE